MAEKNSVKGIFRLWQKCFSLTETGKETYFLDGNLFSEGNILLWQKFWSDKTLFLGLRFFFCNRPFFLSPRAFPLHYLISVTETCSVGSILYLHFVHDFKGKVFCEKWKFTLFQIILKKQAFKNKCHDLKVLRGKKLLIITNFN